MSRYGLGTFLRHFFIPGGGPEKVLRYNLAPAFDCLPSAAVERCRATGQWGQGVVAVEGQTAITPGTKLGVTVGIYGI